MIVNSSNLEGIFRGFSTSFSNGFKNAPTNYEEVAMIAPSSTAETTYAWLNQVPRLREWLGDRHLKGLSAAGYTIKNRKFEVSIEVERTAIEDDQYGVYGPLFTELGRSSAAHPDELIFELLKNGFETPCYDGQPFFDDEHPTADAQGQEAVASNISDGSGPAWYLFDTSRAVKPLILQKRLDYELQKVDNHQSIGVFMQDTYLYGVRNRSNAGFGLWQLAHASKQSLDPTSYAAARTAMMSLRGNEGRLLGIQPTTLVVPPSLEAAGRALVMAATGENGSANVWHDSAKLIVTPWLA